MRNSFVYLLVIIGIIVIFYTLLPSFGGRSEESLTTVIAMAKNNEIREIGVDGNKLNRLSENRRARRRRLLRHQDRRRH